MSAESSAKNQDAQYSTEHYLAVPMDSLVQRKSAVSDLYIRLPSDRMVKIAHVGGAIDTERIARIAQHDIEYLYVHRNDFSKVVNDLVHGVSDLSKMASIATDIKVARFFSVAQTVYSELLKLPISDAALGRAIRLSSDMSTTMCEKPEFLMLVKSVISLGDKFAQHSLGTVLVANMLSTQLGWTAGKSIKPLTMGAFFHDIGLKEIPAELHFKKRLEMSHEEIQVWETHPAAGIQILSQLSMFSPEALRIVQEHHEVPNGQGFPTKMRHDRIFPLARVVSFANVLAHDLFEKKDAAEDQVIDTNALIQKIDHIYSVMYGRELAKAARGIFVKNRNG